MIKDRLQIELDEYYDYENDLWVRYTHRLRINQINELIKSVYNESGGRKGQLALDAGCGSGVYSIMLAESGYNVTAINISKEEIQKAKEWAQIRNVRDNIECRVEDIRDINSPDSRFDLIICTEVLEHLDNPVEGAKELYRVLARGGTAIITMPNMASAMGCLQLIYRKSGLRALSGKPPLNEDQLQYARFWFGNITEMLRDIGFKIKYQCSTYLIPFLWNIDNILQPLMGERTASFQVDRLLGTMPVLKNIGFNFIVIATKEK